MSHQMEKPDKTIPLQVWADIDAGIAALVAHLNTIPGVRTYASCQGTIGEGGPRPYPGYVMANWPEEALSRLQAEFKIEPLGEGWGYVRLKHSGSSSTGTERGVSNSEVAGSNPASLTKPKPGESSAEPPEPSLLPRDVP